MNSERYITTNRVDISVVIPVYECNGSLVELYKRLTITLKDLIETYEIIFVDDCGPSNPWSLIKGISEKDSSVVGVRLSRNFGQHAAIIAGLTKSTGDWVVVMDCDLQDRPEEIKRLYQAVNNKIDIAFAQRIERNDSLLKKTGSKLFHKVLGYLTETSLDASVANFGIYNRKVIDAVLEMKEIHKYFPILVRWVGFRSVSVPISHDKRKAGETSYTLYKLIRISINIIISFSDKPLRLIVKSGFVVSILSIIYAVLIFINTFINNSPVPGWASVMVSIWVIGGFLISIIGIVGLYVGRSFDEIKKRPVFIVQDGVGRDK